MLLHFERERRLTDFHAQRGVDGRQRFAGECAVDDCADDLDDGTRHAKREEADKESSSSYHEKTNKSRLLEHAHARYFPQRGEQQSAIEKGRGRSAAAPPSLTLSPR